MTTSWGGRVPRNPFENWVLLKIMHVLQQMFETVEQTCLTHNALNSNSSYIYWLLVFVIIIEKYFSVRLGLRPREHLKVVSFERHAGFCQQLFKCVEDCICLTYIVLSSITIIVILMIMIVTWFQLRSLFRIIEIW